MGMIIICTSISVANISSIILYLALRKAIHSVRAEVALSGWMLGETQHTCVLCGDLNLS